MDRFLPNQYENRVCKYFSFEVTKGFNLGLSSKSQGNSYVCYFVTIPNIHNLERNHLDRIMISLINKLQLNVNNLPNY